MFDNHAGRPLKLLYALQRGIGVGDIIERQLFTLQLHSRGYACLWRVCLSIECRLLMRIFAIAHVLRFAILGIVGVGKSFRKVFGISAAEVIGYHAIVTSGMLEGSHHQFIARLVGKLSVVFL